MHFAVSDIHGSYKEFLKLIEKIDFDEDNDILYVIGDVVDRGPDPIGILKWMMKRPNAIPIVGNHEWMALRVLGPGLKEIDSEEAVEKTLTLDYLVDMNIWMFSENGGNITADRFRELSRTEQEDILDYVRDFSLYETVEINGTTFVMIHTLDESIKSLNDLENKQITDLGEFLISRPDFENGDWDQDEVFIVGHTPTWFLGKKDFTIFRNGNLINIDCGCSMGGKLAAMCLETMEVFYVSADET